jgi:hypothetical protein
MTQDATVGTVPATRDAPELDEQKSIARFYDVVADVIGVDSFPHDQHFLDIGGDSLSMAIIVDWIGQEFGAEPEVDWFFESADMTELVTRWWSKLQTKG